jgi:deoxyadenosine/deoxycytidine kinase
MVNSNGKKPIHIAIAGNIGSGKTTLTGLLAKHYGWEAHYETANDNPYIDDFYKNMKGWSFNLQVYFLNSRMSQIMKIRESGKTVIQDRTLYEDAYIFATNLHEMDLMSTRDFDNYFSLFQLCSELIQPPDLTIYLRASVPNLVKRIQSRSRDYENNISLMYLQKLNHRYETWIQSFTEGKYLIIDTDKIDFTESQEDLSKVINKIDAELFGLF